jgi:hypothetical protein
MKSIFVVAAALLGAQAVGSSDRELTIAGPKGALAGTLTEAGRQAPVVLIVPGSGPTDRDGNNPLGVAAAPYRMLAESLAKRGVSTLRIDKRGLFASKAAVDNPNAVTIADYAADVHGWAKEARRQTGASCVWLLGHSEGGLVALVAAQDEADVCGVITVAAAGRPLSDVMREQLRSNPANAPILGAALAGIDTIEKGGTVDTAALPGPLKGLFNPAVQPFLRDMFAHDPGKLAASLKVPLLIVQGGRDLQVTRADAEALHAAQPASTLRVIDEANHVLKVVPDDRAANMASYADPSLPLAPGIAEAIADFVIAGPR